jgi:hypothetical protein
MNTEASTASSFASRMQPKSTELPIVFGALVPWMLMPPSSRTMMRAPSGLPGLPFITLAGASLRSTMSAVGCHSGLLLAGYFMKACNTRARFADADAITQRHLVRLDQIEKMLLLIDDD